MLFFPKSPLRIRLAIVSCLLVLLGLLFAQFTGSVPGNTKSATSTNRSEKINLALRRTVDRLLRSAGDSTSRIPAVKQINPQTFRVSLARSFNYDQLPALLQESLQLQHIAGTYNVAVLDCATNGIQLGYSMADLAGTDPIACKGRRSIAAGCYTLQLTFDEPVPDPQPGPVWPALAGGGLLAGLLALVWRRSAQVRSISEQPDLPIALPTMNQLCFGQSSLDVNNQVLTSGTEKHNLTYREAKLLRLLASHPNQVLERDQILKQVWEDEGIIVGRSVDVFISRLRKLLHSDSTLKIAAIHGVGYRLDVKTNQPDNG